MTGQLDDRDRRVVEDPRAPPQALFEVAGRRWDLHPAIDAHPRVYQELRQWISEVNPAAVATAPVAQPTPEPQPTASAPPTPTLPPVPMAAPQAYPVPPGHPVPPPRRGGLGWWLA